MEKAKQRWLVIRDYEEMEIIRASVVQLLKVKHLPMHRQMKAINLFNKLKTK